MLASARPTGSAAEPSAFGERLRRFRHRAGLSQEQLAERAGLAVSAVGALEQGLRRRPYPHTVAVLARALGLSPEEHAALMAAARASRGARAVATEAAPIERPPSNLPAPRTALIGRAPETAHLRGLLADPAARLVTVTGTGGVGKTGLALHVAHAARDRFAARARKAHPLRGRAGREP
jgi:transcriptional regulator with XRE-family HTH domain